MVYGKCISCGKGRIPLFTVKHGKVTRLPESHKVCPGNTQITWITGKGK